MGALQATESGGARRDSQRAVAHVYALGGDRLALRLGQAREAELADAAVARQLVQELAGQRHAVAAGAAVVGAAMGARGLQAEDGGEVSRHGPELRVSAGFPSTDLEHPSTWAANCEVVARAHARFDRNPWWASYHPHDERPGPPGQLQLRHARGR